MLRFPKSPFSRPTVMCFSDNFALKPIFNCLDFRKTVVSYASGFHRIVAVIASQSNLLSQEKS